MSLRIAFMGSPDFAVPTLATVLTVATRWPLFTRARPVRPAAAWRAESRRSTAAEGANIEVLTPRSLKDAACQQAFADLRADVGVVVAYGLILPKAALEAPRAGCLNLHASALPRWRGAAPIARAVMAGDTATAASIMRMDEGLDTGPVCLTEAVPLRPDMTAGELHDTLAERGARLMVQARPPSRRHVACRLQPEAGYLRRQDRQGRDRHRFHAHRGEVHHHARGRRPFRARGSRPARKASASRSCARALRRDRGGGLGARCGAHGGLRRGRRLSFLELQRAGRRPMSSAELLRGFPLPPGTRIGARLS